ncbi:hypothetical protein [Streptomyces sp. GESEQ-35]|uniref:golvesin C-terminal-like domain-containing protein n=1 Tax=Streptomyces sp. GESEQ-35 TaxID=2812657 RepID=UPI001B33E116|nr:hypothetical protein [Streptomyces sp. GESEQ-35]
MRRRFLASVTVSVATALAIPLTMPAQASEPTPPKNAAQWQAPDTSDVDKPAAVASKDRAALLGSAYKKSTDTAFTTSGDGTGFHLLVAEESNGYAWKTAATLSEPGFDTDTWIGNACLTASGKRAVVSYAPRTFTNKPELMARGAFAATVDLTTGKVTKLPFQASLAYFSPGCGSGEQAVFTQLSHEGDTQQQTRLISVDATTGRAGTSVTYPGQVTSAVPTKGGIVAAHGNRLVSAGAKGRLREITRTKAVPFQLTVDADGGLTYIDRTRTTGTTTSSTGYAQHMGAGQLRTSSAKAATVASGKLTDWDLASSADGTVYITGKATGESTLPRTVRNPGGITKGALLSSHGHAAVTTAWADGKDTRIRPEEALTERTARTWLHLLGTEKAVTLDARPGKDRIGGQKAEEQGAAASPALPQPSMTSRPEKDSAGSTAGGVSLATQTPRTQLLAASPSDPSEDESERTCSVARNDVKKQAFQPTPRQVEWAVDQAVVGKLDFYRAANWKNTGMGGYQPQGLFPPILLEGDPNGSLDTEDGDNDRWHIPSQILLGITAQESNMWQATRYAVPGVTANSLIGNYYGVDYTASGEQQDPWAINWADADCGYGITQATDGMRLPGHDQPTKSVLQQEAIALDYTANIAAGAQILSQKWNETRKAGMKVNDGHPKSIENWFFALWAYNSGFYPQSDADSSGHWGVGWTNNPANPLWKANRLPFLENASGGDNYADAAHPQDWPYEEKVIGWAARPIAAVSAPGQVTAGYVAAWWNNNAYRTSAKPPVDLFCDSSNSCVPSKIGDNDSNDPGQGACTLDSGNDETNPHWLHCWWNKSVEWKNCTALAQCGNQVHRFNTSYPEQPDANSYPPRCTSGLPSGAFVIDDLPNGVTPAGSASRGCGAAKSDGTFTFNYNMWNGTYPGKMDTHQIGAGYGNHFWFAHTRQPESTTGTANRMEVTGTWKLGQAISGQAKVYAHIPDHGAQTAEANYKIKTASGTRTKTISQTANESNKWVDLGAYRFNGTTPEVSLSNFNSGGTGDKDIAWDAVAFVPGDYDDFGEISFPDADPDAPDPEIPDSPKTIAGDVFPTGVAGAEQSADLSPAARTMKGMECRETPGRDDTEVCIGTTAKDSKTSRAAAAVTPDENASCSIAGRSKSYTRFEACMTSEVTVGIIKNGVPQGNAYLDYRHEIDLAVNSKTITQRVSLKPKRYDPTVSEFLFSINIQGFCLPACTVANQTWSGSPQWTTYTDFHEATTTIKFDWDGEVGHATDYLNWILSGKVDGKETTGVDYDEPELKVRCDNEFSGKNAGCVFQEYVPSYPVNTKAYPAAATLYWVLQQKLANHPGSKEHNMPLHRLADTALQEANRNIMCKLAAAKFLKHDATPDASCDEYAFAASRESGGMQPGVESGADCAQFFATKESTGWKLYLDDRYDLPTYNEVCGRGNIPQGQNTSAGGGLGRWTPKARVLDGDAYYVYLPGFEGCDPATFCQVRP